MTKIRNMNESGYNKIGGYAYPFVIRNGFKKGLAAVMTMASLAGTPAVMLTGCDNGTEQTTPNKEVDELLKEILKTNPNFNVDTHNQSVRGFSYNGFGAIKNQPVKTQEFYMAKSKGDAHDWTIVLADMFATQSTEIINIFDGWKKDLPQDATKSRDFADNIIRIEIYITNCTSKLNGVSTRNNLDRALRDRGNNGGLGMHESIKTFFSDEPGSSFDPNWFDKQMQV